MHRVAIANYHAVILVVLNAVHIMSHSNMHTQLYLFSNILMLVYSFD